MLFGNKELLSKIKELYEWHYALRKDHQKLRLEVIKLKNPPQYNVGDVYPDETIDSIVYKGGVVSNIKLQDEHCAFYCWEYEVIVENRKVFKVGKKFMPFHND